MGVWEHGTFLHTLLGQVEALGGRCGVSLSTLLADVT